MPLGVDVPLSLGTSGSTTLDVAEYEYGLVHPAAPTSTTGVFASPGASFNSLERVPQRLAEGPGSHVGGADVPLDMRHLPLAVRYSMVCTVR